MTKTQQEEKREAIERLRELLKPGQEVLCIMRHVSRSGMQRVIDLKVVNARGEIEGIGWSAALALGDRYDTKRDGIVVGGCGMDMGFHLVYSLGRVLFPDGFAPSEIGIRPLDGKRVCVNIGRGKSAGPMTRAEMLEMSGRGWRFEGGRNRDESGWDSDGGYALKHRWL